MKANDLPSNKYSAVFFDSEFRDGLLKKMIKTRWDRIQDAS